MPNPGIHLLVADRILDRLRSSSNPADKKLANIIQANKEYYYIGAIGPDTWSLSMATGIKDTLAEFSQFHLTIQQYRSEVSDAREKNALLSDIQNVIQRVKNITAALTTFSEDAIASIISPVSLFLLFGSPLENDTNYFEYYWGWADMLHLRRTGRFAKNLWDQSRINQKIGDTGKAYTLGYISHITTDVTGHPFVSQVVGGPARNRGLLQHITENHMDVNTWERGIGANINNAHLENYLPRTIPQEFSSYIHDVVKLTYPLIDDIAKGPAFNSMPKDQHTDNTFMDCFSVFKSSMIVLTSGFHIDPPIPPSTSNIQQALSDLVNDLESGLNEISQRHQDQGSPPKKSGRPNLKEIIRQIIETIKNLFRDLETLCETAIEVIQDIINAGVAIATDTVEAYLYVLECLLYEGWRFLRSIAMVMGLIYPELDEVDTRWYTTSLSAVDLANYYPEKSFGTSVVEKTIAGELLLNGLFPEFGLKHPSPEQPTTIISPYSAGSDPSVFMNSSPQGNVSNISPWSSAPAPSATDKINEQMIAGGGDLGNAIDLWFKLFEKIDEFIPNFNLDGDRGYGYKCWRAWDIYLPPTNNPLLDPPADIKNYVD